MGNRKKKAEVYWVTKDERYHFKYRDQNGNWKAKSTGKTDLMQALEFKKEFLQKLEAGTLDVDQGNWSLKQASDRWLEWRKASREATTAKCERLLVCRLIEVFGEDKKLKTFTPLDLESYVLARKKKPSEQTGRVVGPRTLILELRCLRWILDRAGRWTPAMGKAYKHLHLKAPKERIGKVLTEEQVKKFVALSGRRERWFVAFHAGLIAYETTCRKVEIRHLQLKHIFLDEPVPYIVIERSKTDAGHREIHLTSTAQWALRKLVDRAHALGAHDPEHFLLPMNRSKIVRPDDPRRGQTGFDLNQPQRSWDKAWKGLRKAAGLGNFRFHDLRCCAITNMALAGVPAEVRLSISGHTSEAMNRHYTFILANAKANAVKALETQHAGLFASLQSSQMGASL